jgi:quercetin dioxygenase-like cupin family protein
MSRLVAAATVVLLSLAVALGQESSPRSRSDKPKGVLVFNVKSVKEPGKAAAELVDIHESEYMVSRVMRLAPGAAIKEHYHPNFDETFFVHAGTLKLSLDDKEHKLRAGDTVIMPAGTIISGTNTEDDEAVLVIVWANIGKKGPLFVHGRPEHQKKTRE